jgi:aspartyl protease family protein
VSGSLKFITFGLLLAASAFVNAVEIVAEGLLPGMAVLRIDDARVTLRPGETHGSVRLVEVSARKAVLNVDGVRREIGLSERVDSSYTPAPARSLTIRRNAQMQYITTAEINGRRVQVLVDTGATNVAMNAAQARALGIGDDEGVVSQVQTASEILAARQVQLRSVVVGQIGVEAVNATVIDGEQPSVILLGMSFLQHVRLDESDGILILQSRW